MPLTDYIHDGQTIGKRFTSDGPMNYYICMNQDTVMAYGEFEDGLEMVTGQPQVLTYPNRNAWKNTLLAFGIDPDAEEEEE
jgi:hypothetical protein